jgi:hypothetical protein
VPLVEAFEAAGAERLTHAVLAADHAFTDTAPALHAVLVEWTAGALRPPPPRTPGRRDT